MSGFKKYDLFTVHVTICNPILDWSRWPLKKSNMYVLMISTSIIWTTGENTHPHVSHTYAGGSPTRGPTRAYTRIEDCIVTGFQTPTDADSLELSWRDVSLIGWWSLLFKHVFDPLRMRFIEFFSDFCLAATCPSRSRLRAVFFVFAFIFHPIINFFLHKSDKKKKLISFYFYIFFYLI